MGTTDSNGIYQYDGTDQVSPIHTLLNLGQASVSARIQATPKIVANTSARTTYASGKTVNASNPLLVWRADAPVGRKLEYSINGTDWFYYSDSADADIAALSTSASGWTSSSFQVVRVGSTVWLEGNVTPGSALATGNTTFATVPAGFRPASYGRWVIGAYSTASAYFGIMTCSTAGVLQLGALGSSSIPSTTFYVATSWRVA